MKSAASQCCFCGNQIVEEGADPVVLTVEVGDDEPLGQQSLFCHYRCLKRALDPSVPLYPLEAKR